MQVRQAMSADIRSCTPDTPIPDVARMMLDADCGAIPVLDAQRHPIGLVTDRDITLRTIARNQDPLPMKAADCMTQPVCSVRADADLEEARDLMERRQIRRVPVTDDKGVCCGMLAQADIARLSPPHETAEFIKDVSKPQQYRH